MQHIKYIQNTISHSSNVNLKYPLGFRAGKLRCDNLNFKPLATNGHTVWSLLKKSTEEAKLHHNFVIPTPPLGRAVVVVV